MTNAELNVKIESEMLILTFMCHVQKMITKGYFRMYKTRREVIREILTSKPFTSLKELQDKFPGLSSMTLRRDIEYFEKKGEVIKVRGGARSMKHITVTLDESFDRRQSENISVKKRIARHASSLIETGRSIFFDSGTTLMELVPYIPDERLTITTTGPNIAIELLKNENVMVNLVGGFLNRNNISVSGAQSIEYIENINIDIAFISPSGFSLRDGFTSGNWNECELKKLVVKKAAKTVVLLDTNKIEKSMPYTFCGLDEVHTVITNERLPDAIRESAKEKNIEIVVV